MEEEKVTQENKNVSAQVPVFFQFIMIGITSVVISLSIYLPSRYFVTSDPAPTLMGITPQLIEQFKGTPGVIATGIYLDEFSVFDPVKNDFVFSGVVWFEFDPVYITLDLLSKFSFQRAEILERSAVDARIVEGKFFARYNVKVRFKTQLNYRDFPFDDHRIYLQLVHPYVSLNDVVFESVETNFIVTASTKALGWNLVGKHVHSGYIGADIKALQEKQLNVYYPSVLFSIDYSREGIRYPLIIILPLLLLFFITTFAFSIDVSRYVTSGTTLAVSALSALIAYRFVIENLSPSVGYFMISDGLYFLFLCVVTLIFILSFILNRMSTMTKSLIIVVLHALVWAVIIYLMFFWIAR